MPQPQTIVLGKTIGDFFLKRVQASPDLPAFTFKPTYADAGPLNEWRTLTFKEFYQDARLVAFGLMNLGVKKGDKIAILSSTRYEWSLSDISIMGAGGISVPIYPSNTPDDVCYILDHSESSVAIVEDGKQLEKILSQRLAKPGCLPHLRKIVVIEPAGMSATHRNIDATKDVLTLSALRELGKREEARSPTRFDDILRALEPSDPFTICYTSGTTGVPKGAVLPHDAMASVMEDCKITLGKYVMEGQQIDLAYLPFSHILGRTESISAYCAGWKTGFAENIDKLMTNIGEVRPTLLFAVPRIFEKAYTKIHATVEAGPPSKKKLFDWAVRSGREYYADVWAGRRPGATKRVKYELADRLVFAQLRKRFGGRLRYSLCGGAPLPREIGEFFQVVGITICEGYGLTETCAATSFCTPETVRFGTVGKPLPEVNLKIADDGEILVKSRKLFTGYYKNPEATAEALEGGWFHTGDIGHLDDQGVLHITDRKKDLIVTSAGKNVAPQKIENLARSQKLISQFVVHGDRRNYLTALVTLEREAVIRYAHENQILFSEYSELVKNPKILSLVQHALDEINRQLASFESIKKFVIVPSEFTVESGELTPSLKVRRNFVNKRYKQELDSMYDAPRAP
jgi:long-chain acyl-CoA synthetase